MIPSPLPKQVWIFGKVKATVLLWFSETVPTPLPSVCKNIGTMAVAFVLLITWAVVVRVVKIGELGSLHSVVAVDP